MKLAVILLRSHAFEVIEAPTTYVVHYREAPFTLRRPIADDGAMRYRRTSFSLRHHAERLASRLNAAFDTAEFTVRAAR